MSSTVQVFIVESMYIWLALFSFLHRQALGIVCVGIMGNEYDKYMSYIHSTADIFFLLITTTFMLGTFILLLSCVTSLSTASMISKTIYVSTSKYKIDLSSRIIYLIRIWY